MQPDIKKDEIALFRNIFGAFLFDLSVIYLIVVVISLFIPDFYSGDYYNQVSFNKFFIFYIFFYIVNLIAGLFSSQTLGMKVYNIYYSKGFNFLNLKTKIPLPQNTQDASLIRYFFVFILDIIIGLLFVFLFAVFLKLGILTNSIPTGGFLIDNSVGVFIPHLIFSILFYYIFSISVWGKTPGMAILKIRVPFYKRTITIFERLILLIFSIVLFFLIAPYFLYYIRR